MSRRLKIMVVGWMMLAVVLDGNGRLVRAADLSGTAVKDAIERAKKYLTSQIGSNGSWSNGTETQTVGVTSLVLLALINSGMTPQDVPVKRGLQYLRTLKANEPNENPETYQVALLIMALSAAKDKTDSVRIGHLAQRLESGQIVRVNPGAWGYGLGGGGDFVGGDNSNTQFAVLGLREAVEAGAVVSRETWQRNRDYWVRGQNHDGGWAYTSESGGQGSYGSMTVAGVSSLAICEQMLRTDTGVDADGNPPCCAAPATNKELDNGLKWLAKHFSAGHNPAAPNSNVLYYIYGAERAGRLSGQRFFGEHDWYREGATFLIGMQNNVTGRWNGAGHGENDDRGIVATSYGLLFLSKGLAPVLVNKLKYGPRDRDRPLEVVGDDWNKHRRDVRNLTEHISGLSKWPKLLTSQEVDIARAVKSDGVNSLLQAPVLFITGKERPQFAPEELQLLKEYLQEGGFIFAAPTCLSTEFEAGLREVLIQILPPGEAELKPLPPDHPVFRSEYLLTPNDTDPTGVKLLGVDFGCRTTVIYSPEDLGCLWDYWAKQDPPKRNPKLKSKIDRATKIGVNVMAYATGREPPDKTEAPKKVAETADLDNVERGLLQIAQIRHDGAWNAAPRALRNLLVALNDTVGLAASTKPRDLTLADPNVLQYPILYMHGRNRFAMNADERKQLQEYLKGGGVLFADACCGAKPFDRGFREFANSLYPDKKLERIPVDHELFSEKIGRDIRKLKRRTQEVAESSVAASMVVREAEPFLEGIEIDGRLAVIYSRYDISCALERQAAGNCEGYLPEDAVKLATNIVLYALLQELRLADPNAAAPK